MTPRARALLLTARPKTLSAAIVPIIVATALVRAEGLNVTWWVSVFALLSATMIQIGTNFLNDAIDFVKGADSETRLGPERASQSGWFGHRAVFAMGLACLGAALLFGVPLVWQGGLPILAIGIASLILGYAYTGGPMPLAYVGLGDLFVILFFGVIAVGGVFFLHTNAYTEPAIVAGLQIGLLATVLLAINNLRDVDQDRLVNKKTLAVRLGKRVGRLEVPLLFALAFGLNAYWFMVGHTWAAGLSSLAAIPAILVSRAVLTQPPGRHYNGLLAKSSAVHVLFGLLFSLGLGLK